jgi:hypothetical protein
VTAGLTNGRDCHKDIYIPKNHYRLVAPANLGRHGSESLRGHWRHGPFKPRRLGHNFEEWFDPARLSLGDEYGPKLSTGGKASLIAFLKTM